MDGDKVKSRKRAAASKTKEEKKVRKEESDTETLEDMILTQSDPEPVEKREEKAKEEAVTSTAAAVKKSLPRKAKEADVDKATTSSEKASASKLPKPKNRSILQLKITLSDINPPIWRRIQVLNNNTFYNLRQHINEAMGWMSDRSHQFVVHNPKKNSNILIVDGALEGITYDFEHNRGRLFKEENTKLSKYFSSPGDVVSYEFDLGDSWMHQIVLEKILPPPGPKAEYPKCTGGKRACPPEDCGGVDGYHHLLEVYKDPQHEEYEELIGRWLQDLYPGYDPEYFDRKKVFQKVRMWV
ncbi:PRiA4 ORF3 domain containing protein [Asbolus verrucosus]|uniref:PRiA4 ORF3 domain containing protein n=1 Tax=Asbolus verrucosus TaxID=1661398 RepID=A0A482VR29_ASBVE|nr:PRiA4 ORF3 domain containing protein [Asbolus verrucosus]